MSPDPVKTKTIFLRAVEKHQPNQWQAFLDQACGDSPELRREVEVLLAAHAQAGAFLENDAVAPDLTIDRPITEKPGTVIGPYKLLQQIGEGGFGVVYMADQVGKRGQVQFAGTALRVLRTNWTCPLFPTPDRPLRLMDSPFCLPSLGIRNFPPTYSSLTCGERRNQGGAYPDRGVSGTFRWARGRVAPAACQASVSGAYADIPASMDNSRRPNSVHTGWQAAGATRPTLQEPLMTKCALTP